MTEFGADGLGGERFCLRKVGEEFGPANSQDEVFLGEHFVECST